MESKRIPSPFFCSPQQLGCAPRQFPLLMISPFLGIALGPIWVCYCPLTRETKTATFFC